jgi:hypothetical protein
MLGAAPRRKISRLLGQLEAFKCRPWDRGRGRSHAETAIPVSAGCSATEESEQFLDQFYDFVNRPEFLKLELETLSERSSQLNRCFHEPDYVVAQLKEQAHNLERWYKLMLEPGYLAAEVKATWSWWHHLSLGRKLPIVPRKNARNDIFRLLEFLRRLNFDFAAMTLAKVREQQSHIVQDRVDV